MKEKSIWKEKNINKIRRPAKRSLKRSKIHLKTYDKREISISHGLLLIEKGTQTPMKMGLQLLQAEKFLLPCAERFKCIDNLSVGLHAVNQYKLSSPYSYFCKRKYKYIFFNPVKCDYSKNETCQKMRIKE